MNLSVVPSAENNPFWDIQFEKLLPKNHYLFQFIYYLYLLDLYFLSVNVIIIFFSNLTFLKSRLTGILNFQKKSYLNH